MNFFRRKKKEEPQARKVLGLNDVRYDPKWEEPRVIHFIGLTLYIGTKYMARANHLGQDEFWLDGYAAQTLFEKLKEIDEQ